MHNVLVSVRLVRVRFMQMLDVWQNKAYLFLRITSQDYRTRSKDLVCGCCPADNGFKPPQSLEKGLFVKFQILAQ